LVELELYKLQFVLDFDGSGWLLGSFVLVPFIGLAKRDRVMLWGCRGEVMG